MNETVAGIIKDLFLTANGRIFTVGAALCLLPGYFTYLNDVEPAIFDFVILGAGFVLVLVSAVMATYRATIESKQDNRQSDRPKSEPTRGHEQFLEFIKPHLPVTVAELRDLKFGYDEKRTKPELLIASKYQRMEFWVKDGTIIKYGDQFDMRDSPSSATIFEGNA